MATAETSASASTQQAVPSSPGAAVTNLIKSGDFILVKTPSGDVRNVSIQGDEKQAKRKVNLGKFGSFTQAHLIGHPYGLAYEIMPDGNLKVRAPERMEELGEVKLLWLFIHSSY